MSLKSSYGQHHQKRPSVRRRRMENFRRDSNNNSRLTCSSHENCNCFVSSNPGSSSRHFENTLKVLEKKGSSFRRTISLSSIREESSALDLELQISDRLRELKEKCAISLSKLNNLDEDDDDIIYFMSRDRNGSTNLKMRFVNSLSNLSTIIRTGINQINDNGKLMC